MYSLAMSEIFWENVYYISQIVIKWNLTSQYEQLKSYIWILKKFLDISLNPTL